MRRVPRESNGMLKLVAWALLLLAAAVLARPRLVPRFSDDFSGRPAVPPPIAGRGDAEARALLTPPHAEYAAFETTYAHAYDETPGRRTSFSHDRIDRALPGATLRPEELPALDLPDDNEGNIRSTGPPATIRDRAVLDAMAPMVDLAGGEFRMGSDRAGERDGRPRHRVRLSPFRLDRFEVTGRQFRLFVNETGYRTSAERNGWSHVFDFARKRWTRMAGACWWNPTGTGSATGPGGATARALDDYPVVHVSWDDATAFCRWARKRLPSEAEWEYAAKGGRVDPRYPWGDERVVKGRHEANTWQGWFPDDNSRADGFLLLAPVGSFPANGYGLHDLGGNAWEWCGDRYADDYYRTSPADNPTGPGPEAAKAVTVPRIVVQKEGGRRVRERFEDAEEVFSRVVRGGSFLSAENGDAGYRVTARGHLPQSLSFQDVGFRCAE